LSLGNLQQIGLKTEAEMDVKIRLTLAAETCRLLQGWSRGGSNAERLSPQPPRLFISHAKRDAEDKAEELKKTG